MPPDSLPAKNGNAPAVALAGAEKTESPPLAAPEAARLVSLDAFRGFIMFWIIGGEAIADGLQALTRNPLTTALVYELRHSPWQGLRFYDCIWPSFMLMVGISIPFSLAKRSLTQTSRQLRWHALQRTAVLFLLGSVRESVFLSSPYLIELSSALQPIAIAYLVAFLLARTSAKVQALVAALILAGYALLLALVPAPGIAAGTYALNHNLVNAVDVALLREHWMRWPYAPEGWGTILSTLPTVSTTLLGLLIGEALRSGRTVRAKLRFLGGAALVCLVAGYAISPVVPIVMKMWTASYGLVSAGWACLMFLVFYVIVDVWGYRKWTFPLVIIGSNAVFIYMLTSVLPVYHLVGIFTEGIAAALGPGGPLFSATCVLVAEWLLLFWMYRRKLFLRA